MEMDFENEPLRSVNIEKVSKTCMSDRQYRGVVRLHALCLAVMCILQATLNITLRLRFNPEAEAEVLNRSYYNLTFEELQTTYGDLVKEKKWLQTSYTNVASERDRLRTNYTSLLNEQDQLIAEREGQKKTFPNLVNIIRSGWIHFRFSLYYISTEKKSWGQSRMECRKKGADLVIINSQEEEDFITEQLGNKSQAWVGLKRKDTEREWKWVDGNVLKPGRWSVEQPNDGINEPHAGNTDNEQNWISTSCTQEERWVCEKPVYE